MGCCSANSCDMLRRGGGACGGEREAESKRVRRQGGGGGGAARGGGAGSGRWEGQNWGRIRRKGIYRGLVGAALLRPRHGLLGAPGDPGSAARRVTGRMARAPGAGRSRGRLRRTDPKTKFGKKAAGCGRLGAAGWWVGGGLHAGGRLRARTAFTSSWSDARVVIVMVRC